MLVDSSVWMSHERAPDPLLCDLLRRECVVGTAEVIYEIMLGCGRRPIELASEVRRLPQIPPATEPIDERLEAAGLRCRNVGVADARIILAALGSGVLLYSKDRSMNAVADGLGIRFTQ